MPALQHAAPRTSRLLWLLRLAVSAPAGPAPALVGALAQSAPGSGLHSQPAAPALTPVQPQQLVMPGAPLLGQPGAVGFPPGAGAPTPRKGLSRTLLAVIVLAGVLTLAIPGFFILNGPGSTLFLDRHGLPNNVPLPTGVTFQLKDNVGVGGSLHEWDWTVASPNDPATVRTFYQSNLPSNGWSNVHTLPQGEGEYIVTGCQSSQVVEVTTNNTTLDVGGGQAPATTITAPAGGATLQIVLSSDPGVIAAYCSY